MKLLILGSTGATGQLLVKQSLEQGHSVTALARDPAKLSLNNDQLTIIKGDALDRDCMLRAVEKKDAVLSCLGRGHSFKSHHLITNAVSVLVPVMIEKNVRRLIFLSAAGVGENYKYASNAQKFFFRFLLKDIYADKAKAEEQIRSSDLDWTLVYPVLLTNKPYTGKYKVAENIKMRGTPKISRADTADFMLRQLLDKTYVKRAPTILYAQ
jgi:putative NADH-flavin reductase